MAEQETENMTNQPLENEELTNNSENSDSTNENNMTEEVVELSVEEQLKAQLDESKDQYLRLMAEFENFKKRTRTERIELIKTANADAIKSMITVLDDFDRAQKAIEQSTDVAAIKDGLNLVHHKLKTTLVSQGLKELENSIGKVFDTDLHEAVTNIPAPTEDMKGKVVDELEKGYLLNDKVIRFAKVVVGA
jgi:molecular chaperone GrpE